MNRISKPELALLAGLVVIILSIVLSAVWTVRLDRPDRMARDDLRRLVDAGQRFNAEYGVWFASRPGQPGDVRFGQDVPNWELVNVLRAVDGPGNVNHVTNPHRIVFLDLTPYEAGKSGVDKNGEYLDPWGTPYQVAVDANANGVCAIENTIHGAGVGLGFIAWSCGPDRRSDTPDDILSWTEKDNVKEIGAVQKEPGPPLANPPY
jgi:hypothetical protein